MVNKSFVKFVDIIIDTLSPNSSSSSPGYTKPTVPTVVSASNRVGNSAEVSTRTRESSQGGIDIDVLIERKVGQAF